MARGPSGSRRLEGVSVLIPEHKIEEVLARVDLIGVVSRHVELKKADLERMFGRTR